MSAPKDNILDIDLISSEGRRAGVGDGQIKPESLLGTSSRYHLALLYESKEERSLAELLCLKQALAQNQFCIYASVDMHDQESFARLASSVLSFDTHVQNGDLLVVDFKPFYDSALTGDLSIFVALAERIEDILAKRASSGLSTKTLIIADAACNLTKNRHFGEAAHLETWWQDTHKRWTEEGFDITIMCAHPSYVQKEAQQVIHNHSLTCTTEDIFDHLGREKPQALTHTPRPAPKGAGKDIVIDTLLSVIKQVLGMKMAPLVMKEIHAEYLGREIGIKQCVLQRPDLFERAFLGIVGRAGENILGIVCNEVRSRLQMDGKVSYKKSGDLKGFLRQTAADLENFHSHN